MHQKQFVIDTKVEVTDWGNIEAIKAGIKDPKQMAEYMEKLRREREGIKDDPETQENTENQEAGSEKPKETPPPLAPVPDLSASRV